jgi:hypothetical protein
LCCGNFISIFNFLVCHISAFSAELIWYTAGFNCICNVLFLRMVDYMVFIYNILSVSKITMIETKCSNQRSYILQSILATISLFATQWIFEFQISVIWFYNTNCVNLLNHSWIKLIIRRSRKKWNEILTNQYCCLLVVIQMFLKQMETWVVINF